MLHFEVEKTNPWGIFFLKFFLKSQFLFYSDIPEIQVGGPINQQIKNMWPNVGCIFIIIVFISESIWLRCIYTAQK
jgi:hypothetical protein